MWFIDEIFAIGITQSIVAIIILFSIWKIYFGKHRGKSIRFMRTIGWEGRSGHIYINIYFVKDLKTLLFATSAPRFGPCDAHHHGGIQFRHGFCNRSGFCNRGGR
jgi:hypothetical protein